MGQVDPEILATLVERIEALEELAGIASDLKPAPLYTSETIPYGEEFSLLQQIASMSVEDLRRFALYQALKVAELQNSVATLIVGL